MTLIEDLPIQYRSEGRDCVRIPPRHIYKSESDAKERRWPDLKLRLVRLFHILS